MRQSLFRRGHFEIWTFRSLGEPRYCVERTPSYARWIAIRSNFLARQHKWTLRLGKRVFMVGFLLGGKPI